MSPDDARLPLRRYRVPVHGSELRPGRTDGFRVSINFGSEIRFESRALGHPHIVTFARHGLLLMPGTLEDVLRMPDGRAYGPRADGKKLFSKLLLLEVDAPVFEAAARAVGWPAGALAQLGSMALVMDGMALHVAEALRSALSGDGARRELLEPLAQVLARWILLRCDQAIAPTDPRPGRPLQGKPLDRQALIAQALARIDAELDQKLSVQALADGVGMSRSYFLRAFKACTGLTPHQHLLAARVERARQLMEAAVRAGRPVSLGALAHDAGFGSHSQFSAVFRAHVGMPPSDWLAQLGRR